MRRQQRVRVGMGCLAVMMGVMGALAASPAARAGGVDETARTAAAVMAVDQHWLEAETGGDVAWLEHMLLPGYRSVGPDGVVHPKSAILASARRNGGSDAMKRKVAAWQAAHPTGQAVAIQGDTAILTFYDRRLGPERGVYSADIFVYVDGRWQALYSQHSGLGKG